MRLYHPLREASAVGRGALPRQRCRRGARGAGAWGGVATAHRWQAEAALGANLRLSWARTTVGRTNSSSVRM